MILLAIDTSTSAITVAVHDGTECLASGSVVDARRHTEQLAPLLRDVLADAGLTPRDVTDVVVGTGPGPFTGLRVGIVTGLTFAHALGIRVHGVCSLDALAHGWAKNAPEPGATFLVASDARRKEVYHATYRVTDDGRAQRLTEPAVSRPGDLPSAVTALPTVGRGAQVHPEHLPSGVTPLDVDAADLAAVAAPLIAAGADLPTEPLYLRRPDAVEPAAVKSTLAADGRGQR
ncbi:MULTISPECIES: tRNA (adenosine(37)-N6)-threonylcarbamoyltransferase complex dimerization subunit type 1 TsaB [unclassified Janibacter]|uniref:tRNA (adenosine(37)-N6)-threonylcarbamoyltransferase complex dimerization subunit type 1 TsaB n=1 Tax=unclassified Janibacter TaxID=2649294 RepID=UPI003CFEDD1F